MSIASQLACAQGRNDEAPNIALAQKLAAANDAAGVAELVALLTHKDKAIQSDSIKAVYEVAGLAPKLVAKHIKDIASLLRSKNNRMVWGAMAALHALAPAKPDAIYALLPDILETADKGSVITKDRTVGILIALANTFTYREEATDLLLAQLQTAPNNQLAMYAEQSLPVMSHHNKEQFLAVLEQRMHDLEKDSQKKRVEKVLKKLHKL